MFLPFLVSLIGQAGMAKMLCLVTSVLALLLSVAEYGAVLSWIMGMLIAGVSVWERIRQRAWFGRNRTPVRRLIWTPPPSGLVQHLLNQRLAQSAQVAVRIHSITSRPSLREQ